MHPVSDFIISMGAIVMVTAVAILKGRKNERTVAIGCIVLYASAIAMLAVALFVNR
jgi:hypothetical protein